jgi:ankyrin repeat protein
MTRNPIRRTGLVLLSLLLPLSPLSAEDEKDLRELLRDALYTEEVTRDPEAAAKQYEALLSQHDTQRAFAASALFRLAEVRRKQNRKDEAITLYQKLLDRFPEAGTEAKLARENLASLGGAMPSTEAPVADSDDGYIEHLRKIAASSPDRLKETFLKEISDGRPKVIEFLLSQGVDPKTPKALTIAAEMGNLAICKLLLRDGKPSPEEAGRALSSAIQHDRSAVLSYLLEQGVDPNAPVSVTNGVVSPLIIAAQNNKVEAAKILIDRGADIDFMIQSEGFPSPFAPFGAPLHNAVQEGSLTMFRLLLERGAKADLPTPKAGLTPLHLAASMSNPASETMVKELLARGADPNRKSTLSLPDTRKPNQTPGHFALVTPFEVALRSEMPTATLEAMLAKGANPNLHAPDGRTLLSTAVQRKNRQEANFLLKAGADPDVADKDGSTPLTHVAHTGDLEAARFLLEAGADPNKPSGELTPLFIATKNDGGWPIVELLLAKGAKPDAVTFRKAVELERWDAALKMLEAGAPLPETKPDFPYAAPLVSALRSAEALPLIEKMIAMGAKPEDAWIKSGFNENHYGGNHVEIARPLRSFLFRRFILPRLEESPAVRLVMHGHGETRTSVLDDPSPPLAPRSLAQSLLEPTEPLNASSRIISADRVTIWRKSGEGWTATAELPLDSKEDFPALQRGDVIEITDGADPAKLRDQLNEAFVPELRWSLRKRVSFPVTVEIDGKAQEVMLRGDRLVFDPATPGVVPLAGARRVMEFLWQPEISPRGVHLDNGRPILDTLDIVLRRDGWPDVRLPYGGSGKDFPLRAGDRITFVSPNLSASKVADLRKARVTVKAANGPFVRQFGKADDVSGQLNLPTIPTLLQAVAEVTQLSGMKDAPDDPVALRAWLLERSGWLFAYVQRPDLSKIRIRRLQADGTEKTMAIDLAKTIAETREDASIDEVRKADVELQAGDIVEIPSLPADDAKPWTGLSPKEESFFSKALSCRIQVTDEDGNIRVQEIRFHAPKVIATDAGLIPVPLAESVTSLNGAASLPMSGMGPAVSRNGLERVSLYLTDVFLREGDRIVMSPRPARVRSR